MNNCIAEVKWNIELIKEVVLLQKSLKIVYSVLKDLKKNSWKNKSGSNHWWEFEMVVAFWKNRLSFLLLK